MSELKIHLVAAARPNFMKIAPLYHALKKEDWARPYIVHTGQHYDLNMSDAFFEDLRLPKPHIHLGIGSGTHAEQTGKVMMAYENVLLDTRPDLVVVVGDVNSTMACTLATVKISYENDQRLTLNGERMHRPAVAHLEAGLRSFDWTMPEEINRIVTDTLCDILWTPSPDADENLRKEGIAEEKIIRVGNIMIDSLEMMRGKTEAERAAEELGLGNDDYAVVTLHRPSNVDTAESLGSICGNLAKIAEQIKIVFPLHPRTRKNLASFGLLGKLQKSKGIVLTEPYNYVRFMSLVLGCRFVLTDSGWIQEETTYLGIPCLTLRPNTERPITIQQGTNRLTTVGTMVEDAMKALNGASRDHSVPELWDGKTAERIVASVRRLMIPAR